VAFAGGNVRFISEEMPYQIYILLMTPNGRGMKDPNGTVWNSLAPPPLPTYTAVFNTSGLPGTMDPGAPLNEKDIIP